MKSIPAAYFWNSPGRDPSIAGRPGAGEVLPQTHQGVSDSASGYGGRAAAPLQQYQDLEEVNEQLREEAESWKERCFAVQARQKMEIKKREMLRDQCEDIPKEDIRQTD